MLALLTDAVRNPRSGQLVGKDRVPHRRDDDAFGQKSNGHIPVSHNPLNARR